jgi:hypothetical protein
VPGEQEGCRGVRGYVRIRIGRGKPIKSLILPETICSEPSPGARTKCGPGPPPRQECGSSRRPKGLPRARPCA